MKGRNTTKGVDILEKYKGFAIPYSEEAEIGVVWYALNSEHESVLEFVRNKALFYDKGLADIYDGIIKCSQKGFTPSPLNLLRHGEQSDHDIIKRATAIKKLNKPLNDLVSCCMTMIEIDIARKVLLKCSEAIQRVYDNTSESMDIVDEFNNFSDEINQSLNHISKLDFQELKKQVLEEVKERVLDNSKVVKTNISELDEVLGGFENGSFSVIAARPSMGKTAFLIQLMYNIAVIQNKKVLMFNLEMTKEELCKRFIALHTKFSNFEIKQGFDRDMSKYNEMLKRVESLTTNNIYLIDNLFDGGQIFSKAKQMVSSNGVELVFFDYIQLSSLSESGNREQEMSKISRMCKQTAKLCKIPVIALSQLNRSVETRAGDKRPQLSDIRESGAIEQDADNVMFLYRPEYYQIPMTETGETTVNMLEVIIAKARNGLLRTVKLHYEKMYNEVTNWNNRKPELKPIVGNINDFENQKSIF